MNLPEWELGNDWEYSEKCNKLISVRVRLEKNEKSWKNELKPSDFVPNIIEHGYILPILSSPTPLHASNNKSSLRNRHIVSETITKLLSSNCIEELDQAPYCCNPLSVAEEKKLRLVLNLGHVNKFIKQQTLRCENLNILSEMTSTNNFFYNLWSKV